MSFASQIISSINKDDSSDDTIDTTKDTTIDTTIDTTKDIGFNTDIDTQIKNSNTYNPVSSSKISSEKGSNKSGISNSYADSIVAQNIPYSFFGISTQAMILVISIGLITLRHNNIEVFSSLGDVIDTVINFTYEQFIMPLMYIFYTIFEPFIVILKASLWSSSKTVAVGARDPAEKNVVITDTITAPVLDKKMKINKSLQNEINNKQKSKKNNIENDDIDSSIQKKSDWCYIGEDQGVRKCVHTGDNKCMSDMMFTSYDNCVNNI